MSPRTGCTVHDVPTVIERPAASEIARKRLGRAAAIAAFIVFGLAAVHAPQPSGPSLDQSWRLGLTMAALQHLRFGHDIVFTFGPLGYVLQGTPTPELARSTAYLTAALLIVASIGIWSVCSGRSGIFFRAAFALSLVVMLNIVSVDYVVFAGSLAFLARTARSPRWGPWAALALALVAAFGLLSKQTLGLDVLGPAGVFWVVQFIQGPRRRRIAAAVSLVIAFVVCATALLIAFGSVANVMEYLSTSREIIAGYSSAMSLKADREVMLGGVAIFIIVALASLSLGRERKLALSAAIVVTLFLAWKHGFVRADDHVIYFFVVAGAAAPLIGIAARGRYATIAGAAATTAAFCGLGYMTLHYHLDLISPFDPSRLAANGAYLVDPVGSARRGAETTAAALAGDQLPPDVRHAIGKRGVDVISAETALVPANGFRWNPLPVFQSYTAYTPALDALNARSLSTRPPDFEFFRFEDIDGRFPFSAEPETFAELLCDYSPTPFTAITRATGKFILLARTAARRCSEEAIGTSTTAALNTRIAVPVPTHSSDLIRVRLDLRTTALGKVASALWRPPTVLMEATYRDGMVQRWRLVPETTGDGVVISPMPRGPDDARRLFAREPVPDGLLASIRILAPQRFYRLDAVRFTQLSR